MSIILKSIIPGVLLGGGFSDQGRIPALKLFDNMPCSGTCPDF